MAPVSSDSLQIPFYVLVAGAVVFTLSVVEAIKAFQSMVNPLVIMVQPLSNQLSGWRFARQNGCQAPLHSVSHGFFGIGMIFEMVNAGREHNFVELLRGWHRSYGETFKARMATRNIIFTVEPKNIQTILALKFKDYGLGGTRQNAVRPVFGEGIFTVDGSKWEHSRALLRPSFTRAQIADTQMYEKHVVALLKHIPRDGSTIQLQNLFFRQVTFS
jgi:hypothetical protein